VTDNAEFPRVEPPRGSGRTAIDLALQVANVAAQVSAAMRSADAGKRSELESRLVLVEARLLEQQDAPEGLLLFLDVMQGLLRDEDVSDLADDLPAAYRAVYEQLVGEVQTDDDAGTLTVRQVMDEVTNNVILAMVRGTFEQRRRMADTLLVMEQESLPRPDLEGLRGLLQAARLLLQGADPTPIAGQLRGPFKARWEEILEAIRE
jgi:hypothetical protein